MNPPESSSGPDASLHLEAFSPDAHPAPAAGTPGAEGVTMLIKKATAETLQAASHAPALPRDPSGLIGKSLLGVLTYCYARGVYESAAIEAEMRRSPALQRALPGPGPEARLIQRFRRLNHDLITSTLERYFVDLRHQRARARPPEAAAGSGNTTFLAHQQAVAKLNDAIVIDTLAEED